MINIKGVVTGDKQIVVNFGEVPDRVRSKVEQAMIRIVIDLQSYVVKNKLSGQLLKRRTGTLAASIQQKVTRTDGEIVGVVGSRINDAKPLKYAPPLEDGFSGTVTVKEHLRQMNTAFGHAVKNPRKITVKAHGMKMNVKGYNYLKGSLAERQKNYVMRIKSAVTRGINNES